MTRTVAVPLWLLILILLFAGVTFASHFLFPSVRWFFRRRMERVVARLNRRLKRPIEPFKLARRYDMIQRLIYDPDVTRAVAETARLNGIPDAVAFGQAKAYAREIVPAFSATMYFTIGARLARWLSRHLYRVRLAEADLARLDGIDADAAVVFVINHRSNMDYVLVTWLVSRASALSYAVGEWARVWPLSGMIRMMGAYFIRRRDRSMLYRRVLARYVQMATEGGVTQAMFPEGRLSLDGRPGEPKMGLLSYIVDGMESGGRDVIFVPVGINYDRVIEDRFLIAAGRTGERRFRPSVAQVVRALAGHAWERLRGRYHGFGVAKVVLGAPVSAQAALAAWPDGLVETRVERLAEHLMDAVRAVIPVVPVALVARHLRPGEAVPVAALEAGVAADLAALGGRGGPGSRRSPADLVASALLVLEDRRVVVRGETGQGPVITLREGEEALRAFYADSITHLFTPRQLCGDSEICSDRKRPEEPGSGRMEPMKTGVLEA